MHQFWHTIYTFSHILLTAQPKQIEHYVAFRNRFPTSDVVQCRVIAKITKYFLLVIYWSENAWLEPYTIQHHCKKKKKSLFAWYFIDFDSFCFVCKCLDYGDCTAIIYVSVFCIDFFCRMPTKLTHTGYVLLILVFHPLIDHLMYWLDYVCFCVICFCWRAAAHITLSPCNLTNSGDIVTSIWTVLFPIPFW